MRAAEHGRMGRVGWWAVLAGALAEGFLRDQAFLGAMLFSFVVGLGGALSGEPGVTVVCVGAGLAGMTLAVVALARRWPLVRQWIVFVTVCAAQIALMGLYLG